MAWWRFLVWNVAGGVVWATSVALIAYWLGEVVASQDTRVQLAGSPVSGKGAGVQHCLQQADDPVVMQL